jgi:phosphocarrier protein
VEIQKNVSLSNRYGLHARPAMKFVEQASQFQAEVYVIKDDEEVNGKSIMGLMTLAAECGSTLRIRVVGEDAQKAVDALTSLVESRFGEDGPDDPPSDS